MQHFVSDSFPEDEITLQEVITKIRRIGGYLLSRWLLLLITTLVGGILGFAYAYFIKPVYTATTSFVLEEEGSRSGLGQYAGLASIVGVDLGGGNSGIFQGDNIIELYKSRTMIEKALLSQVMINKQNQLLVERYLTINNLREKWASKPELANFKIKTRLGSDEYNVDRLQDSIVGEIVTDIKENYLSVSKPDKKLSIINVQVHSKDELFAKSFNDQIVKNVNDFYIQTKTKKSMLNVSILQHKTDSVRAVMNGAIYSAVSVSDNTPNLNQTRQIQRVAPIQRSNFTVETNKTILGELIKNLELTKMSLLQETPLIQIIDKPILPLDRARKSRLIFAILGAIGFFVFISVYILVKKYTLIKK